MKLVKEELKSDSQSWLWFKEFEKSLIINLLKAQECFMAWRNTIRSIEFWNITWLWTSFLMKICTLRITFAVGQGAKKKLMSWVSSRVPKQHLTKGFPECFTDGILICALTESLVPGACPRFDLLDPDQSLRNLKLALHLVEKHIKIRPDISPEDILHGGKFTEKRLLLLTARMKLASEKFNLTAANRRTSKDYMSQTTFVSEKCFARGMGLLLAVRGRTANFTILLDSTDNLDMVIEIRGPRNTACNKRITNGLSLSRSESAEFRDIGDVQIVENILNKRIPLTYRILGRKISVSYTPLESGTHYMSIIWQGQHIMGSPYTVTVDSSIETPDIWHKTPPIKRSYSRLKRTDSLCFDESIEYTEAPSSCLESSDSVKRKRVLRYIVRMDGSDVVIDGREDICEAINNIKEQQRNCVSQSEGNEYYQRDDSYFSSKNKIKKNCSETSEKLRSEESMPSENSVGFKSEIVSRQEKETTISDTADETEIKWESKSKNDNKKNLDKRSFRTEQETKNKLMFSNATNETEIKWESKTKNDIRKNLEKTSQRTEQEMKNKLMFSNATEKTNMDLGSESKTINTVKFKEVNEKLESSNELYSKTSLRSKDCDTIHDGSKDNKQNNEYKDPFIITPYKFSEMADDKEISDKKHKEVTITESENANDKTYSCNGNNPFEDCSMRSAKAKSKSKVTFADDQLTNPFLKPDNEIDKSIRTCLKSSRVNSGSSPQSSSDDLCFFPVHKVEYEILQEDDMDCPGEFNTKRRTSFTELHESNYLDDDNIIESVENGKQEHFLGGTVNSEKKELQEHQGKVNDVMPVDTKNSLRTNFSLFECDHSSAFWSETGEETLPENVLYDSEGDNSNKEQMWKNKLRELEGKTALNADLSVESEECNYTRKNDILDAKQSCSRDFYGFNDSENEVNNLLSFSSISPQNAYEEDQSDTKRRSNLQELSDNRKRLSWSDRDILPAIRESSVEGLLDSDINIANSDKGIIECSNMLSEEVKTDEISSPLSVKSHSVSERIGIFEEKKSETSLSFFDKMCNSASLTAENHAKGFKGKEPETKINHVPCGIQDDSRSSVRSEDLFKNKSLTMNILSAAPYKSRNQEIKQNEDSCLRTPDIINSSKQQLPFSERPISSTKDIQENFILTYAAPVVIDDCQGVGDASNNASVVTADLDKTSQISNYPDTYEVKSAQSLSVKKVIQIFQKEKEEPIDTWPTEIPQSKSQISRKQRSFMNGIIDSKSDTSDSESSVPLPSSEKSLRDIPRSSIKDRVKLFEKEEKKENLSFVQKNNSVEKYSSCTVSAKKNYWENVTLKA